MILMYYIWTHTYGPKKTGAWINEPQALRLMASKMEMPPLWMTAVEAMP